MPARAVTLYRQEQTQHQSSKHVVHHSRYGMDVVKLKFIGQAYGKPWCELGSEASAGQKNAPQPSLMLIPHSLLLHKMHKGQVT